MQVGDVNFTQELKVNDTFRLPGLTLTFRVVSTFLGAGFIPCVTGYSLGGGYRINVRVADVQVVQP